LKRRIIALLLSVVICTSLLGSLTVSAAGYTPKYTSAAETLYELGLFKGVGTDASGNPKFALEQKATRLQGLVMLLRLLGKEEDALAYTGSNPFTDVPDWGKPYVGYAYENKLTNGTSATTFTPDGELLGKAYLTFVLRALGYDDAAGDFSYNDALTKAKEVALISDGACTGAIYRDDCVIVSLKALTTDMKDGKQTLAEKLVKDGVLTKDAIQKLNSAGTTSPDSTEEKNNGTVFGTVTIPCNKNEKTFSKEDVVTAFPNGLCIASGAYGFAATWGDKNAYNSNFSLKSLLLSNSFVRGYCEGKRATLSKSKLSEYPNSILNIDGLTSLRFDASEYKHEDYDINTSDCFRIYTILDNDFNLIAYCVIPPYYSGDTLTFTTCFYDGRKEIDAVRTKMSSFERTTPKLDKNLFAYERDGEIGYLRFDEDAVTKKIGKVAYYSTASTASYDGTVQSIGSVWASKECNLFKDFANSAYGELYTVDEGCSYGAFTREGAVIFLYNEDKETIGYIDCRKEGLTLKEATN